MTMTMREAALMALEMAARKGQTDTRILENDLHQAEVYALLAIAEALEKLAAREPVPV